MSSEFPFKVETTKAAAADREAQRWPVRLRPSNTLEPGRTWIFTDGGGAGRYAAALARPKIEERRVTGCREGSAKNVVAELDGVILGLEHSLPGKKTVIVSDYLWTAYYINRWHNVYHTHLREDVARAREIIEARELSDVVFVHYGEDPADECEFSKWNRIAHQMCHQGNLATSAGG